MCHVFNIKLYVVPAQYVHTLNMTVINSTGNVLIG